MDRDVRSLGAVSAAELAEYCRQRRYGMVRRRLFQFIDGEIGMRIEFKSAKDIPAGFWKWPHIDPAREWASKGDGSLVVETDFLANLEKLRQMFGRPLIITSGYRDPAYNRQVASTGDDGPHTTGRAVDIRIYGSHAYELVALALGLGFTGIGLSQKGEQAKRFVHLDDLRPPTYPRPWIWTY